MPIKIGKHNPDWKYISIEWTVFDVWAERPDLTEDQCVKVLEYVEEHHDCDAGITWRTLEDAAQTLFPKTIHGGN